MKITPDWWQNPDTELPSDKSAFDVDDTLKAILERNPIASTMENFSTMVERVVSDEVLRKSIKNQEGNSLIFVPAEIRQAMAQVLFAMKNPHRAHDSGRVGQVQVDPVKQVQGMNQRTDASFGRISGDTTSSKSNAKDLPVSAADIDRVIGDDVPKITDSGAFRTLKREGSVPTPKKLSDDTKAVSSDVFKRYLEEERRKKEGGNV